MSSRFIEDNKKTDKKSQLTQISWNNFIFNFNNSHIFYPLNDLAFFNADFQGVKFYRTQISVIHGFTRKPNLQNQNSFHATRLKVQNFTEIHISINRSLTPQEV